MRIAFVLPGLHRIVRGAEVAFESIAHELATYEAVDITLFGSGRVREDEPYKFIHISNLDRQYFERWPKFPIFRTEYVYEEFTFALNFWQKYQPQDFDVTITCSYPFLNWILMAKGGEHRPYHIFVTQNSDYPAIALNSEYRFFDCDGLICTNPEYFERNRNRWHCELIPNGVNIHQFFPGEYTRNVVGLPQEVPIVLMVSALTDSKRIMDGIRGVSQLSTWHLVVCGDGPQRDVVKQLGQNLMPGRFHLKQLPHEQMPNLYRSADVLLHLSLDEPFGNIYLEALATGLPIVAHDRAVTRWILEDSAIFVDTQDLGNISTGIQNALGLKTAQDVEARREIVNRRFSWQAIGKDYYRFLNNVINIK